MHSPERICEALAWLYGVEWELSYAPSSVHLIFKNKHGDLVEWMDGAADLQDANNDRGFGVPINDNLAHALEVTAPWEWKLTSREQIIHGYIGESHIGHIQYCGDDCAAFCVREDGSDVYQEGYASDVDSAKSAARTSYLTYMRGRLALRGLEK